jgi:hypothetical protein
MSDPDPDPLLEPATSVADEAQRIWRLYETDGLDEDQATLELLRLGIAARRAARGTPPRTT